MDPWFSPIQIFASLGLTVPLFVYYSWRIYSLIVEHGMAIGQLNSNGWIDSILSGNWNQDDITSQLGLNNVFLFFDKKIGSIRRCLRSDIYSVILIGFIGTLLGMIGSFTTLLLAVDSSGVNPTKAITTLVKGGLSTALVSSLIAAILACIVMSYLSLTDRRVVELKAKINGICLTHYQLLKKSNKNSNAEAETNEKNLKTQLEVTDVS
jgi:hypothetical protein